MADRIERPMSGSSLPVDLVNTVWNNDDGDRVDWLSLPGSVQQFCADHGAKCSSRRSALIRDNLITNRSLLTRLFEFVSSRATENDPQLTTDINSALETARVQVTFNNAVPSIDTGDTDPELALATEALLAGITLSHDGPNRLRCCARHGCILWFWDGSKAGRRQWCSMDRCGNRVKAQRHYDKKRELFVGQTGSK